VEDGQASWRSSKGGRIPVRFGSAGAAKGLFALRQETFPPWDKPILDEDELDIVRVNVNFALVWRITRRSLGVDRLARAATLLPLNLGWSKGDRRISIPLYARAFDRKSRRFAGSLVGR
jgi:hypothetical protein